MSTTEGPFTDVRCTRCGGARLARRDGTPGACSYLPCPSPLYDVKRETAEEAQAPRAASADTEGSHPAKPLTGAELAAKHGFEPIPEWKRDPVARPMQSAASGDASKEET